MFLLNDRYASVLFDTGADKSYISAIFLGSVALSYRVCPLPIDLMPVDLGSFDVVVGMDCLSLYRAEIVCFDKIVQVPLPDGDILLVFGEKSGIQLNIISCMKSYKYLLKGYT